MKNYLITGGTGSIGNALVKQLLQKSDVEKIIIYSRDELKQFEMANKFKDDRLRFFIGDVRDFERIKKASEKIDCIIHAAALKQVPAVEYNPFEAIKTNIIGSQNVINAAIENNVKKVIALTTDKACLPVNLYGATKLVSEKLFLNSHVYQQDYNIKMSAIRYGNIAGSRGSIIPLFKKMVENGEKELPLTSELMTRFWFNINDAVNFILSCLEIMSGQEVFIPKLKSFRVIDLIKAFGCEPKIIGIRQGEKLHEQMINEYENYLDFGEFYIIKNKPENDIYKTGFNYTSDKNEFYTVEDLKSMIKGIE